MKAHDQQGSALAGEERQRRSSDTKDRQRRSRKPRLSGSGSSWATLILTLLFFVSLSLTYALIQPQPHTGLAGRILAMTPLFNDSPTFLFSLAIASLMGLMWLPSQQAYSTTKPDPFVGTAKATNRLAHTTERPALSSSSFNILRQPIRKFSLH
jgi:hypothetical protein